MNVIFVFYPDAMLENMHSTQACMTNVFSLRFRQLMCQKSQNMSLKEFLEEYDLFHDHHSMSYSKLTWNDACDIIYATAKILSTKIKLSGSSNHSTANIKVSPWTALHIKSKAQFVSHPLEEKKK